MTFYGLIIQKIFLTITAPGGCCESFYPFDMQYLISRLMPAGLLLLMLQAPAQQIKHAKPGPPGSWQQLGFTTVDFKADRDVIIVTGADHFRKLKFKVQDNAVNMLCMLVVYENGAPDKMDLRFLIPAGGESRVLDLRGNSRRIRKVEFWYQSQRPGFRGKAKVWLWGIK